MGSLRDRLVPSDAVGRETFLEAQRDAQYDLKTERQAYFMRNPHMAWLVAEREALQAGFDPLDVEYGIEQLGSCGLCGCDYPDHGYLCRSREG